LVALVRWQAATRNTGLLVGIGSTTDELFFCLVAAQGVPMVIYEPGIVHYATRLALFVVVLVRIVPFWTYLHRWVKIGGFFFLFSIHLRIKIMNERCLPRTYMSEVFYVYVRDLKTKTRPSGSPIKDRFSHLNMWKSFLSIFHLSYGISRTSCITRGLRKHALNFTISFIRQLTPMRYIVKRTRGQYFVNLPRNLLLAASSQC
jgi:hypothetical protein